MTRILVLTEKHGTSYFDVDTDYQLHITCVSIFKERMNDGYYGPYVKRKAYPKDIPTIEEINSMEPGEAKNACQRVYERWQQQEQNFKEEQATLAKIQAIIDAPYDNQNDRIIKSRSACHVLLGRDGYEYEGAELITPERIK